MPASIKPSGTSSLDRSQALDDTIKQLRGLLSPSLLSLFEDLRKKSFNWSRLQSRRVQQTGHASPSTPENLAATLDDASAPQTGASAKMTEDELEAFKDGLLESMIVAAWYDQVGDPPVPRMEPDMGGGESFWVTAFYQEGLADNNAEYIDKCNQLVERELEAYQELLSQVAGGIFSQLNDATRPEDALTLRDRLAATILYNPDQLDVDLLMEVVVNAPLLIDGYYNYSGQIPHVRQRCLLYFQSLTLVVSLVMLSGQLETLADALGMSPLSLIGGIAEEVFNLARTSKERLYTELGQALLQLGEAYYVENNDGKYYYSDLSIAKIWPYELGLFLKATASGYELSQLPLYKERARSSFDALNKLTWYQTTDANASGVYRYQAGGSAALFSHQNLVAHALVHWSTLEDDAGRKDAYLNRVPQIFEFCRSYLYKSPHVMHDCNVNGSNVSAKWCACCNSYIAEVINAYRAAQQSS
jgi:hypothetical protein